MPATTVQRSSKRSTLAIVSFVLGLAVLWVGPVGCGADTEETASSDAASEETIDRADRSILLNLGFEDHTEDRPPSPQFFVETPNSGRWQPDAMPGGSVAKAFEKFPVGENHTFHVYPQGEDGPRLAVPFTMKPDMSSVLASSRTNIAVYDDSIVVEGPAVPEERRTFDRPPRAGTTAPSDTS